jgi:hypothetical protein
MQYEVVDPAVREPLSFHSVSFGEANSVSLSRMARIATEIEATAPRGVNAHIPSSYTEALDTVRY